MKSHDATASIARHSMSASSPGDQLEFHTASPGEAFYFSSGDHTLFGWLHRPSDGFARALGLVICKPFGYEADCSHQSMRVFADMAAGIGVATLRFDYLGTGDSADIDPQANQLEVWSKDVVAAIDELQRVAGVECVCLLGVRLGAVHAIAAATECRSVTRVALISPIIKGSHYLRELRTTRLAASLHAGALGSSENKGNVADQRVRDGSMEVSGYLLSAATIAALTQVDLTKQGAPTPEMLIIDGDRMPVAREWAETLSANNARIRYMALPGLIRMIMAMPQNALPAVEMLVAFRDWLFSPSASQTEAKSPRRPSSTLRLSDILELPGVESIVEPSILERPTFLSSDAKVFGILTTPREDEVCSRAVIIVNAGATYHAGPNRFHVSLARRWARSGCLVIRMDLSGLGDSATRQGRPDNEVFPPAALDDIRAAIEFVRNGHGIDQVTLCGFCSGAYHALRAAAAHLPVSCLLLVNPEHFFWKEGTHIDALVPVEVVKRTRDHRERIFSLAAWKRLLTGQIDIWRLVRIYFHRPLLAVESEIRDLARRLRVRLPRDLGWELEDIAARGTRLVFVFSGGEAGIDLLRIQGGLSLRRLKDRCRLHIIDGADHIFSQAASRTALESLLTRELFTVNCAAGSETARGPGADPGAIAATASKSSR
jgi:pimeloyl-ACP methyl ester carboxylesterase